MCPTYTYWCEPCQDTTDGFSKLTEVRPEVVECIMCGGPAHYRLSAPMVMKESVPDGTRRKGFQDLKEASKLNVAMARTDNPEEKKELKREMKKTGFQLNNE